MNALRGVVTGLLLVVAGCQIEGLVDFPGEDLGAGPEKRAAVKMVPFQMKSIGQTVVSSSYPDCPVGTLLAAGEGYGFGTHIGKATYSLRHCVDPNATPRAFFDGRVVQVAANGDELWMEYEGHFIGESKWVMSETIVGGTGRFANATGSVTGTGELLPDGIWSVFEQGEISSVGSSK